MQQLEQTTADTWPGLLQWLWVVAPEVAIAFVVCAVVVILLIWELRK